MPALPSGTVTFLFTDIEGSTRLWETYPAEMSIALARHDTLLRTLIEQHDGYVFKTIGDAFCAAFHTAPEALQAAFAAQQAVLREDWPAVATIKVRMVLHTGAAEARDNDYFGPTLNRTARLLSTGHGGQILLSAVTHELVRDSLPPQIHLRAMGEHRLKDLHRPETVFQVEHPTLPAEFAPLKSLDYLPNNLPLQLTSFIGREKEMAEVKRLLATSRLLTLTGAGGSGKTRLSLQAAADLLDEFPDGVWLVELAPLADPALVPQTVACVLHLAEQPGKPLSQTLIEYLKTKRLLLLLDNCEHLLNACATLAEALLRPCPGLQILASSRERLGIPGERTYRVPSLTLPELRRPATLEQLNAYESVRLFLDRALVHKPDFTVTHENAPALASVCHRLDGIPLALELAAARVRLLSIDEIHTRLDHRFRLLTGGSRTALPRQQTLRGLIDWSYDLLNPQERTLLARLSVFAGGWTLTAAEQVCQGGATADVAIEEWKILDLLTGLVDKSLVVTETRGDTLRYGYLESIRQYAADRLVESAADSLVESAADSLSAIRAAHRDYYLALAEEAKPNLVGGEQGHWLAVLEAEHDNLRQAMTFCLNAPDGGAAGLRLGAAVQQFWWIRGHLTEAKERVTAALAHPEAPMYPQLRGEALNGLGGVAKNQGDYAQARAYFEESLALVREAGNLPQVAISLGNLGAIANEQGDFARARAHFEESLAICRERDDRRGIALALGNIAIAAVDQGDHLAARVMHEESLAIRRELGDRQGIALSLNNLAIVAAEFGDLPQARTLFEESLGVRRELGDRWGVANALGNLAVLASMQGDAATARSLQEESLMVLREIGDRRGVALALHHLGTLTTEQGDLAAARPFLDECLTLHRDLNDRRGIALSLEAFAAHAEAQQQIPLAVRLDAAAAAIRTAIGAPLPLQEQDKYAQRLARHRAALGDDAFTATWDAGHALPLEDAVAAAFTPRSPEPPGGGSPQEPAP